MGSESFRCAVSAHALGRDELWEADQIVAGHRQGELEAELLDAPKHGPRKPADRLAPDLCLDGPHLPAADPFVTMMTVPSSSRMFGSMSGAGRWAGRVDVEDGAVISPFVLKARNDVVRV